MIARRAILAAAPIMLGSATLSKARKAPTPVDYGYRLLVLPVEEPNLYTYGNPVPVLDAWASTHNVNLQYQYLDAIGRNWGCNHPTNPNLQDETTIVAAANAWTEQLQANDLTVYPLIVVGMSATCVGGFSILERHPDIFAGAILFDGPMNVQDISASPHWDMPVYYGTQANFSANYRLTDSARLVALANKNIVMCFRANGTNLFLPQMRIVAGLMCAADINVIQRFIVSEHRWDGGWLEDGLENLAGAQFQP